MKRARIVAGIGLLLAAPGLTRSASAQTRPSPAVDAAATAAGPRPVPGPVYESAAFTRAVARGTRTRTGAPGSRYWVQHPRYAISASLDVTRGRLSGTETIVYRNFSPDTLHRIAVYLRQNVFAAGSPRRDPAPVTEGMTVERVTVDGATIPPEPPGNPAEPVTAPPRAGPEPGHYTVDGTVLRLPLASPLLPGDSLQLGFVWSYTPAPAPSDGREGHDDHVFFMGYWYPQVAVYDDVTGWVTDPYLLQAEFYMDPADYDVRLTVPYGWVVDGTGVLENAAAVLSPAARDSLREARRSGRVVRVLTPGEAAASVFLRHGSTTTWHFTADDVRDFAWGTSDAYAWDATRALVGPASHPDTVDIASFFRLNAPAAAWRLGGARYTRDAIQQLSAWLWPYPYPHMTSMEGVLNSGGMEYPMMTVMQPWTDTLSLAGDLMHETGHMWFPMQVGSNETRYPWMDEGFTQFDVAQGMRPLYGEPRTGGRPNDSEAGQRALYLQAARAGADAPLMLPGSGDDYPPALYFVMYYDKTAQALAALRALLGDDAFHRAFVTYGRRWIDRHPTPWDFFNAIADATGRDLSWFWTTWFYEGWPLDQAIDSVTAAGNDSVAIAIGDRGLAPMPVWLAVTRADGSVQHLEIPVTVWLTGARRTSIRVGREPRITRVEIDPEQYLPDIDRANQVWTAEPGGPRP